MNSLRAAVAAGSSWIYDNIVNIIHTIYLNVVLMLSFNPLPVHRKTNADIDTYIHTSQSSGGGDLAMTEKELLKYRQLVIEKAEKDPLFKDRYRMMRSDACRPLVRNWTDLLGDIPILVVSVGKEAIHHNIVKVIWFSTNIHYPIFASFIYLIG